MSRSRGRAPRTATIGFISFVVPVLIGLCASWAGTSIARDEVTDKLQSIRDNCEISISGRAIQNSAEILSALRTMHWSSGHRSHPTKVVNIEISKCCQPFTLCLARDSDDSKEYWVFYPKYSMTSPAGGKEVGRVETPLLDAY
jgi:hypothetical protein